MKRRKFYKDVQQFFDEKLIYEIYSNNKLSICNMADTAYAVFLYKNSKHGQAGLLLDTVHVKNIVLDKTYLARLSDSLTDKEFSEKLFFLSDETIEILRKFKKEKILNGPSPSIDYALEQELMNMMNKGRGKKFFN